MAMNNYSQNLPSEFNSAAQEIARINEIRNKIHALMRSGKLDSCNYELDRWWAELASDKNVNQQDERKFYSFIDKYARIKNNSALTYQLLLEKEVFLGRLQNRLGKGSKYQKKDDSGM